MRRRRPIAELLDAYKRVPSRERRIVLAVINQAGKFTDLRQPIATPGTDPDQPDSDSDGVDDGEDAFPTDPTKS